ncbi:hypothetical protein CDAR_395421 [Caerostris darwini]|uniref:Uncharacterized protein n=1 Tax=Caerostris darwini TaxID=1538125 RepID=A0AAV4V915_9ARAC|nr:hypothetical protein CDAR_395421 [Caerostris darwini]
MSFEEGKVLLGKVSFGILSTKFLMSWYPLDIIDITGMILLIGFIGKKMKDSGYDWNDYDWDQKDPFEMELLGYGCIVLIICLHLFMICIRWQPIFTIIITGVIADAVKAHINSWDAVKAKLSFLKMYYFKEHLTI